MRLLQQGERRFSMFGNVASFNQASSRLGNRMASSARAVPQARRAATSAIVAIFCFIVFSATLRVPIMRGVSRIHSNGEPARQTGSPSLQPYQWKVCDTPTTATKSGLLNVGVIVKLPFTRQRALSDVFAVPTATPA